MQTLGQRLRLYREAAGLTEEALVELLQQQGMAIVLEAYQTIESDRPEWVHGSIIMAVAFLYDRKPGEIWDGLPQKIEDGELWIATAPRLDLTQL
jgi:hypothetical protein